VEHDPKISEESFMTAADQPVPWGIAEAFSVWFLFLVIQLIAGVVVGLVYGIAHHSTFNNIKMPTGWVLTLSSVFSMCTILFLLWAMLRISYRLPFREGIRWAGSKEKNREALLVGLLISTANMIFTILFPPVNPEKVPLYEIIKTPTDLAVFAIFAVTVAPIGEELLFRGWMYPAFRKKMSAWAAILVTTALFAAPHAFQLGEYKMGIVLVGLLGLVNGILREKTGGVKAPFMCHLAYNSVLVIMEILSRVRVMGLQLP